MTEKDQMLPAVYQGILRKFSILSWEKCQFILEDGNLRYLALNPIASFYIKNGSIGEIIAYACYEQKQFLMLAVEGSTRCVDIRFATVEERSKWVAAIERHMQWNRLKKSRIAPKRGNSKDSMQIEVGQIIPKKSEEDESSAKAPMEFLCKVSYKVMKNPMICSDGHSYEAQSIKNWMAVQDISPTTGERLLHKQLIPNHDLRAAIERYINNDTKRRLSGVESVDPVNLTALSPQFEKSRRLSNTRCEMSNFKSGANRLKLESEKYATSSDEQSSASSARKIAAKSQAIAIRAVMAGSWTAGKTLGTAVWPDGNVYEGQWQRDSPHGLGVWRRSDGSLLEGEWVGGVANGSCVYRTANGTVYEGLYHQGQQTGSGILRSVDGSEMSGTLLTAERK